MEVFLGFGDDDDDDDDDDDCIFIICFFWPEVGGVLIDFCFTATTLPTTRCPGSTP